MKRFGLAIIAASAIGLFSSNAMADHVALLGNDLPHITGKAEKLHLHAYDTCKEQEFEGSNRNVIMLQADFGNVDLNNDGVVRDHSGDSMNLVKINDIFLVNATTLGVDDFTVLDGNACENSEDDGATFALPADIATNWVGMLRLRGQPDTGVDIATCWTDDVSGDIVCGEAVVKVRGTGKPGVTNVTRRLLETIDYADSPFWEAFTQGRLKATIYFYPCDEVNIEVVGAC